jgi:hypothetical protein
MEDLSSCPKATWSYQIHFSRCPMQLVSVRLMAQPEKMSKSGHKSEALNFLSSISEEDIC